MSLARVLLCCSAGLAVACDGPAARLDATVTDAIDTGDASQQIAPAMALGRDHCPRDGVGRDGPTGGRRVTVPAAGARRAPCGRRAVDRGQLRAPAGELSRRGAACEDHVPVTPGCRVERQVHRKAGRREAGWQLRWRAEPGGAVRGRGRSPRRARTRAGGRAMCRVARCIARALSRVRASVLPRASIRAAQGDTRGRGSSPSRVGPRRCS